MFPKPSAKVLNLLWTRTSGHGRDVPSVADITGAAGADLVDLEKRRLIAARAAGYDVRLEDEITFGGVELRLASFGDVFLRLTMAGLSWVEHDPWNRWLWVLSTAPTASRTLLPRLVAARALDVDALVDLFRARQVLLLDAETGYAACPPVPHTQSWGAREIRAAARPSSSALVVAALTVDGRAIVRPDSTNP